MNQQIAQAKCLKADRLLQQARTARSDKAMLVEALELYQDVIAEAEVQLAEPYIGLAYVAYSIGDKDDALALLQQAREIDPANLRVQTLLLRMEKATPVVISGAGAAPAVGSLQPIRSLRAQIEGKKPAEIKKPAWEFDKELEGGFSLNFDI